LAAIDANIGKNGNQPFTFVAQEGGVFTTRPGSVIWEQIDQPGKANDMTVIYADNNGDHRADLAIQLHGLIDLHKGDFVL
jgi:hypothetical protein